MVTKGKYFRLVMQNKIVDVSTWYTIWESVFATINYCTLFYIFLSFMVKVIAATFFCR